MYWINGVVKDTVPVSDRSFNYGDGAFTTIRTLEGKPQHWAAHLARMQACLSVLQITQPDWSLVLQWVEQAAVKAGVAGIKLHVSRGSGGRGYSPVGVQDTQVTISDFAYPTHYRNWQSHGVELGIAKPKLGINPLLAGHKHNNRLEQILVKADIEQQGYVDGIVLDLNDHVIETTMANVFWVTKGQLYTPSITSSGVAGVARRWILEDAAQRGISVLSKNFNIEHLLDADEVFMCNSILGVAPIIKITQKCFAIGIMTRDFQERINSA
ncbi:aminodeoxychorismate lyase [Vibrio ezurae]|uniref:Aminodeoxychorismate lyase n=1 Tax=Vibrio ezurae NBRC 102218 TaxID=1219080 RepID=U3B050_9VIBR|nr:aminodeoxychorismate lyase [Vibrio ezurae]GAD78852.1 aminodeoxychorismate lyase [Vibrio ezurae NBRC 102218]